jgi:hypothetical protein
LANLKDKFTIDDLKNFGQIITNINHQVTHCKTTSNSRLSELQLIYTIDHLCHISGMLCQVIEQQLEGHIETYDPYRFILEKLASAENGVDSFLKIKKIDLD